MAYTEVSTPIVYYGGKTAILNHLLEMVPQHSIYEEPFFGGGALFWKKEPARNETINDRLDIVVNFYRTLRLRYRPLKRMVDATLISRKIHNEGLAIIRSHKKGNKVDQVKLAWAFWLCTNFAFSNKIGGGYKYSNDMRTCVPDTLQKRKNHFTEYLVQRIEHAYIENDDALKIARSRDSFRTFHYFDPPYPNADQGHYGKRNSLPGDGKYTFEEYEQLLEFCVHCKGKFLLSSYNSPMLSEFTSRFGWHKKEISLRVGGSLKSNPRLYRKDRIEVLISNYSAPCGTLSLFGKDHTHTHTHTHTQ